MSELNKKKTSILTLVIIYSIIAIIIIIFAIMFHKLTGTGILEYFSKTVTLKNVITNQTVAENFVKSETTALEKQDNIKRVSLSDTFKINNLEIKEEIEEYGEDIGDNRKKVTINYIQISGLKNKTTEDKINRKIKEDCENFVLPEEMNNDEIQEITIFAWNVGNFSNTLSTILSKNIYYKDQSLDKCFFDAINLKLDTGEEISFEDLFTPDVSFKNVITQAAYNSMSKKINQEHFNQEEEILGEYGEDYEIKEPDYAEVENLVFKIVKEFEKNKERKFYFTKSSIFLFTSLGDLEIPMLDIYEYINIFNLVTPENSLFEAGDLTAETFVFGEDYSKGMEFDGKISNYIYLTVYNYEKHSYENGFETEVPRSLKIYEENLENIKNCLINYENTLDNNKGAFYNINACYNNEENNIIFYCEKIEVEKSNFEKNIQTIYQDATRNVVEGELMFYIGKKDNVQRFELTLKDGELVINPYVEPEW